MQGFNWGKMDKTPAGELERKESNAPLEELVPKFEKQAIRDLDQGNAWTELVRDIADDIDEIANGSEIIVERIVEKHQTFLKEEKGLTARKEQMAYIIALAKEMLRRRKKGN